MDQPTVGDWLTRAYAAQPAMRLAERTAALDAAERLLDETAGSDPDADWHARITAERAQDAARLNQLDLAHELAGQVLDGPGRRDPVAYARALEARGAALAWAGTDAASARADRLLAEAADRYGELGEPEWRGYAIFWRGNAVYLQNGRLATARRLMEEALAVLGAESPRRATVLSFYADLLIGRGDLDEVDAVLAEAVRLADRSDDARSRGYAQWSAAKLASARGDAMATERRLRDAERDGAEWFDMHTGVTFLADAAEMLDRVGLRAEAERYLARAAERDPGEEFVRQARAVLLATSGDPLEALDALQELVRGDWLERRWVWRHTLLQAWATFRAGGTEAAELAARALTQAAESSPHTAFANEPELTRALLPLAERAGSEIARTRLAGGRELLIRLFGEPRVARADGTAVPLPPGRPAELVRYLAVRPHGTPVEEVLDSFFGEVDLATARNRLRQLLHRLRSVSGELVVREEDRLRLVPAWVDVLEFSAAADRVRSARGALAVRRAYAALALWSGPPLPTDPYAGWAGDVRQRLEYHHLALLDLVAAEAESIGSYQEAATALTSALALDPHDRTRYERLADQLLAMGRRATAEHLARLAGVDLDRNE